MVKSKNNLVIEKVKWFNHRLALMAHSSRDKNSKAKFIPGASLQLKGRDNELRIVLVIR